MSIYFVQVISSLLGFVLFAALNNDKKSLKALFLPSVLGIATGIVVFKIARLTLHDAGVKMVFDAATLVFLLVSALWIFIKFDNVFRLGCGLRLDLRSRGREFSGICRRATRYAVYHQPIFDDICVFAFVDFVFRRFKFKRVPM